MAADTINIWDRELSYDEMRELQQVLHQLFASQGWKFVRDFIQHRIEGRMQELYSFYPSSVETMVKFANLRGGLDELKMLPVVLETILTDVELQLKNLVEEEDENND